MLDFNRLNCDDFTLFSYISFSDTNHLLYKLQFIILRSFMYIHHSAVLYFDRAPFSRPPSPTFSERLCGLGHPLLHHPHSSATVAGASLSGRRTPPPPSPQQQLLLLRLVAFSEPPTLYTNLRLTACPVTDSDLLLVPVLKAQCFPQNRGFWSSRQSHLFTAECVHLMYLTLINKSWVWNITHVLHHSALILLNYLSCYRHELGKSLMPWKVCADTQIDSRH